MWRSLPLILASCASLSAFASPMSDADYAHDGLAVIYRTDKIAYTVDPQSAELTDSGVKLWLQTDFSAPQGITNAAARQTRNLARADVDCVSHRVSFSQIRYYAESGDLVASADHKTPWITPKEGSIGQTLIKGICIAFVPTIDEANVAAAQKPVVPANAIAQTHPFKDQVQPQP